MGSRISFSALILAIALLGGMGFALIDQESKRADHGQTVVAAPLFGGDNVDTVTPAPPAPAAPAPPAPAPAGSAPPAQRQLASLSHLRQVRASSLSASRICAIASLPPMATWSVRVWRTSTVMSIP
jgi:hypothetical protein